MRVGAAALVCLLATGYAVSGCGQRSPSHEAHPGISDPTGATRTTETAATARPS